VRKVLTFALVLVLVPAFQASAQTVISTNNFKPAPGTDFQNMIDNSMDAAFYGSVTSGTGGPMLWDFSSQTYVDGEIQHSVDYATAPSIDSFPGVNLVFLTVVGTDSLWQMLQSTPGLFWQKGMVAHFSDGEQIMSYQESTADWTFPVSYGNNWVAYRKNTTVMEPMSIVYYDSTYFRADAWGTAKYLSKSVPCLRVRGHERMVTNTYVGTMLINSVVNESFSTYFVAAGYDVIATVSDLGALASPQYTGCASRDFINQVTGVAEDRSTVPESYGLDQNYPNPFNPATQMRFSLPRNTHVRLTVYNVLGRQVKTLVDEPLAAGSYVADWDGTDAGGAKVASGIYLYRVDAGQFSETKKMVLLK
jgi:hypothetical protein